MSNRLHGARALAALAAIAGMAFAGPAGAQSTFDARWQAWLGCWQPSEAPSLADGKVSAMCVSPLNATSAVEVAMVQDGAVTKRDTLDASGVERRIEKEGCVGTQAGRWSKDDRRVFVRTTMSCDGGLSQTGNTIVSMTPSGDWVNIQTLTVGANTGVRAVHYRDASTLKLPAEFANIVEDRRLAIATARVAAGSALDVPAVLEAVRQTDTSAVQAWIVERGTKFVLDARSLVTLADAGVPASVTDVMIGVSYPDHFALSQAEPAGDGWANAGDPGRYADRASCASMYDRSFCDPCRDGWGYDPLLSFGYGGCGFGYRSGYGYGYGYSPYSLYSPYGYGYGYGSPYYGYYSAPVVVVKGSDRPHGKVVNGRGYTQGSGATGSSAGSSRSRDADRGASASSGRSSGSSASSGSSGASSSSGSSGSSSSSSGSTRTAHPRPPQ